MYGSLMNTFFDLPEFLCGETPQTYKSKTPKWRIERNEGVTNLLVETPGIPKEDLKVKFQGDTLVLNVKSEDTAKWLVSDRVDKEKTKVSYKDGVLKVRLPMKGDEEVSLTID